MSHRMAVRTYRTQFKNWIDFSWAFHPSDGVQVVNMDKAEADLPKFLPKTETADTATQAMMLYALLSGGG